MKKIQIDLSYLPETTQEKISNAINKLAWDVYDTIGHPEIVTFYWDRSESLEEIFPELSGHLIYL